jgi:cyanophycinase
MRRAIVVFWGAAAAILLTCTARLNDEVAGPALTGTLVISGGGDLPTPVMQQFVDAAGGEHARIVVVTTASETADDDDDVESDLDFWRSFNPHSVYVLHTRSREIANDSDFVRPLDEATGVWFLGGRQAWLADTYIGTETERRIHKVLARGGVVGGESAGAAIMSPMMIRHGDPEPEVGPGFGLLPGTVIDQHFIARNRQERLMNVLSAHPRFLGLGIDEGTAVFVQGRRLKVMGDSQVVACLPPGPDRPASVRMLNSGTQFDLVAMKRAAAHRNSELASSTGYRRRPALRTR